MLEEVKVTQLKMTRGPPPKPVRQEKTAISFYLSIKQVARLDNLIEKGLFLNRSDAMREALRDLISFYGVKGSKHERNKP